MEFGLSAERSDIQRKKKNNITITFIARMLLFLNFHNTNTVCCVKYKANIKSIIETKTTYPVLYLASQVITLLEAQF